MINEIGKTRGISSSKSSLNSWISLETSSKRRDPILTGHFFGIRFFASPLHFHFFFSGSRWCSVVLCTTVIWEDGWWWWCAQMERRGITCWRFIYCANEQTYLWKNFCICRLLRRAEYITDDGGGGGGRDDNDQRLNCVSAVFPVLRRTLHAMLDGNTKKG